MCLWEVEVGRQGKKVRYTLLLFILPISLPLSLAFFFFLTLSFSFLPFAQ